MNFTLDSEDLQKRGQKNLGTKKENLISEHKRKTIWSSQFISLAYHLSK